MMMLVLELEHSLLKSNGLFCLFLQFSLVPCKNVQIVVSLTVPRECLKFSEFCLIRIARSPLIMELWEVFVVLITMFMVSCFIWYWSCGGGGTVLDFSKKIYIFSSGWSILSFLSSWPIVVVLVLLSGLSCRNCWHLARIFSPSWSSVYLNTNLQFFRNWLILRPLVFLEFFCWYVLYPGSPLRVVDDYQFLIFKHDYF